ncbi:MAG: hypothetical protein IT260_00700 [Saprospiraceae bacterium]|nr:hypothetical protein [Saprospiraceae bacterium]
MHRYLNIALLSLLALAIVPGCQPISYYRSAGVEIQKDPIDYAGYLETQRLITTPGAERIAKVRVRDSGLSMDCSYPDVLNIARRKARSIGGNLLVVTEKKQYHTKSKCFRLIGDIYKVPSLEGLEAQISWHSKRPLMPGDLRGAVQTSSGLPSLACFFTCKTKGDFFNEVILRTETIFLSDSSWLPADATQRAFLLRRAQLHFDLAEVHVRRLKAALLALGSDLPAITGQNRPLTQKQQTEFRKQAAALDAELNSADPAAVLQRWENLLHGELAATEQYFGDIIIDLHKPKRN